MNIIKQLVEKSALETENLTTDSKEENVEGEGEEGVVADFSGDLGNIENATITTSITDLTDSDGAISHNITFSGDARNINTGRAQYEIHNRRKDGNGRRANFGLGYNDNGVSASAQYSVSIKENSSDSEDGTCVTNTFGAGIEGHDVSANYIWSNGEEKTDIGASYNTENGNARLNIKDEHNNGLETLVQTEDLSGYAKFTSNNENTSLSAEVARDVEGVVTTNFTISNEKIGNFNVGAGIDGTGSIGYNLNIQNGNVVNVSASRMDNGEVSTNISVLNSEGEGLNVNLNTNGIGDIGFNNTNENGLGFTVKAYRPDEESAGGSFGITSTKNEEDKEYTNNYNIGADYSGTDDVTKVNLGAERTVVSQNDDGNKNVLNGCAAVVVDTEGKFNLRVGAKSEELNEEGEVVNSFSIGSDISDDNVTVNLQSVTTTGNGTLVGTDLMIHTCEAETLEGTEVEHYEIGVRGYVRGASEESTDASYFARLSNINEENLEVKAGVRVGDVAVRGELTEDRDRLGVALYDRDTKSGSKSLTNLFVENNADEEGISFGAGRADVKRNADGSLRSADYTELSFNPNTGSTRVTAGRAVPLEFDKSNAVGGVYAYYSGKDSYGVGAQMGGVVYREEETKENSMSTEVSDVDLEEQEHIEDMEDVGSSEIIEQDEVEEELNENLSTEDREVAGGYSVRAQIEHNNNENQAITYQVDASGFINLGDNTTVYGRVRSSNGELEDVNTYGSRLDNPVNCIRRVDGDAHLHRAAIQGSETGNITSVGIGSVYVNPENNVSVVAGAGMLVEDGDVTNITAGSRIAKTIIDDNDALTFGADIMYNNNLANDMESFDAHLHYSNTFFDGKTKLIGGIGYSSLSVSDGGSERVFLTVGACQQIVKDVDIYGQYEVGKISGFGSLDGSNGYSAVRLGTQYHFNVFGLKSAAFVEYGVTNGVTMDETKIVDRALHRFGDGEVTVGIGVNF